MMEQQLVLAPPTEKEQPAQQSQCSINSSTNNDSVLLSKTQLRQIVREVDPNELLEEDVEDLMLKISNDFVDELVKKACVFARLRSSKVVEVKDVQLYLERNMNMWIPGFDSGNWRPYKKSVATLHHKQRIAIIKRLASKKY